MFSDFGSNSQIPAGTEDVGYTETPGLDFMQKNDSVQYPTQLQALHKCVKYNEKNNFPYDQTANTFQNVHCSTLEKYLPKKLVIVNNCVRYTDRCCNNNLGIKFHRSARG